MRAGQPVKHFLQPDVSAATQGHKLVPQAAPGTCKAPCPPGAALTMRVCTSGDMGPVPWQMLVTQKPFDPI